LRRLFPPICLPYNRTPKLVSRWAARLARRYIPALTDPPPWVQQALYIQCLSELTDHIPRWSCRPLLLESQTKRPRWAPRLILGPYFPLSLSLSPFPSGGALPNKLNGYATVASPTFLRHQSSENVLPRPLETTGPSSGLTPTCHLPSLERHKASSSIVVLAFPTPYCLPVSLSISHPLHSSLLFTPTPS